MKIFLDFDDVIFNAKKFRNDLIKVFNKHGITKQEFERSYYAFNRKERAGGEPYDPKSQINVLRKKYAINNAEFRRDVDAFLRDLSRYIFPDVEKFLQSFKKNDLFLITYGHERFQKKKIKNSKIDKYFRKVLVCRDDKISVIMDICRQYGFSPDKEDIILIDDHPEQIEETEKKERIIKTFHMCRPQGRFSDLICLEKDFEVNNLRKALRIIRDEKMK